ncbi:MAG: HEAT repeat domain-containing protein [bacterium]|nr:HEAT repeat domain-containing protein [bacterium]
MMYDDNDFDGEARQEKPDLQTTLELLKTGDEHTAALYYGLSDLDSEALEQFQDVWITLDDEHRRLIMRHMVEVSEANFEFHYAPVALVVLDDPDPEVRTAAVEALWESESSAVLNRLLEIAQWDESREVRAAALNGVGRFILMGELGDFPEPEALKAQDIVIGILNNEDEEIEVRRRALEAISNCSNDIVEGAIREAYEGHDRLMQISAVFAMGRAYDEQWNDIVMRELDSADPEMRYEAARAAGELMLSDAIPALSRMAFENDRELQDNAIWSLGEIGGKEAVRVLELLAANARETGDEDMIEAIEDALANASLGGSDLYLMRFEDDEE